MMKVNSIMKKVMVITAVSVMVTGLTACGSRKKATRDTASGGELNAAAKIEKESTEESKMYLQNTSDEKIVLTDEKGNEITITEGETLPIKEKTTDKKTGEEIYVLEDGSKIKASSVNSSAKEVVTTISSGSKAEKDSSVSKETSKNVVKKEENISQIKPVETSAQPQTQSQVKSTEASAQPETQAQPTEAPTQPATQAQPQPTEAPTQSETQAQPQPTEAPAQPVTEAPTKAGYTGYREDLDQRAAQMIIDLRNEMGVLTKNPTWNEHLYKVAQVRAKELAADFSHNSASNARSGYNVSEACTMFYASSEFRQFDEADAAIGNWRYSPDHYDIIMSGDQYAVSCYQKGDTVYWVCLTGAMDIYIAENSAKIGASEWGQPGTPKYEEKYQKYYNSFVSRHGERNIW